MEKASPIWQAARDCATDILKELSHLYPGLMDRFFTEEEPHVLLRFIRYHWQESHENLAKPHYDAGSCTLAIAESEKGLRIGADQDTLKLIEHAPGEALFFLSSNFQRLVADATLKPAWHDVVQLDKTIIGKPYALGVKRRAADKHLAIFHRHITDAQSCSRVTGKQAGVRGDVIEQYTGDKQLHALRVARQRVDEV